MCIYISFCFIACHVISCHFDSFIHVRTFRILHIFAASLHFKTLQTGHEISHCTGQGLSLSAYGDCCENLFSVYELFIIVKPPCHQKKNGVFVVGRKHHKLVGIISFLYLMKVGMTNLYFQVPLDP